MKYRAIVAALLPLLGLPTVHAETSTAVLDNRAAQGDITQPGGARRLSADQTDAIRASLNNKQAKNVILLIGASISAMAGFRWVFIATAVIVLINLWQLAVMLRRTQPVRQ